MIIQCACAIRNCGKLARVESDDYQPSTRFALCHDCEMAVIMDTMLRMHQDGDAGGGMKSVAAFAAIYNGWMRHRKGATLTHKSGVVTSIKRLDGLPPIIVRGN